jgi:invasion protein IalB
MTINYHHLVAVTRAVKTKTLGIAMFLSVAMGATVALGQDADGTSIQFVDWTLQCATQNTQKTCIIKQVITQTDQVEPLLRIELGQNDAGGLSGLIVTPFGLDVTKGISLSIDGGARWNLPFRTCRAFGCVVPMNLGADIVESLKSGQEITVTLYGLGVQSNLNVPMSLAGFTSAYDAL